MVLHLHILCITLTFASTHVGSLYSLTQSGNHKPYTNTSLNRHPYPILVNVIPTNTFLVFQLLVVLTTNNDNCHITKKVMTIITLTILNTYKFENDMLYYGVVMTTRLWNVIFSKHEHYWCTRFNLHRWRLGIHARVQWFHIHCYIHNW
jgi:hypothetical protein